MKNLPAHNFTKVESGSNLESDGAASLYGILLVSDTSEAMVKFYDNLTEVFRVTSAPRLVDGSGTLAGTSVFIDLTHLGPVYFPNGLVATFTGNGDDAACWIWWDGIISS